MHTTKDRSDRIGRGLRTLLAGDPTPSGKNDRTPSDEAYAELTIAFRFFNERLFGGALPPCLLTLPSTVASARGCKMGHFAYRRFRTRAVGPDEAPEAYTDEIALNPIPFEHRTDRETLSTLVHEMRHMQQSHFGKPSRSGYHNKEWGGMMRAVGLEPSNTGAPGGKTTGQQMTHWIVDNGPFDRACADLLRAGWRLTWKGAPPEQKKTKSGKRAKYECPGCDAAVWGKAGLKIGCRSCGHEMAEEVADAAGDDE